MFVFQFKFQSWLGTENRFGRAFVMTGNWEQIWEGLRHDWEMRTDLGGPPSWLGKENRFGRASVMTGNGAQIFNLIFNTNTAKSFKYSGPIKTLPLKSLHINTQDLFNLWNSPLAAAACLVPCHFKTVITWQLDLNNTLQWNSPTHTLPNLDHFVFSGTTASLATLTQSLVGTMN